MISENKFRFFFLGIFILLTCLLFYFFNTTQNLKLKNKKLEQGVIDRKDLRIEFDSSRISKADVDDVISAFALANTSVGEFFHINSSKKITIIIHSTTPDFISNTHKPYFNSAITKGHTIEIQPPSILKMRGILNSTITHEYTHIVIDEVSNSNCPVWLAEGIAMIVAGEEFEPESEYNNNLVDLNKISNELINPSNKENLRRAYCNAYTTVLSLQKKYGNHGLLKILERLGQGEKIDKILEEL